VYGRLSSRIIERRAASDRPFFLHASYTAPHNGFPREPEDITRVKDPNGKTSIFKSPARPPKKIQGMFDDVITAAPGADWRDPDPSDKPEYLRDVPPPNEGELEAMLQIARQRAETLYSVDLAVAKTVRALRRSGVLDNTLVLFTSDNGYFLGEHGIRQGKTLPYEPALRSPLLMRGPGIPAGELRHDPFMSIDFAPTIAELAGATPGIPVDGASMLEVARQGDQGWSRAVLTETGKKRVVRDTDEAGQPLPAEDPGEPDMRWALGIRTSRYLYVSLATKEEELYDVVADPEQYTNLVEDPAHAEPLQQLRDVLARMRACDAEQCQAPLPEELATAPQERP
jgi:N-acetylglucosamine-6-sulfatase